MAMFCHVQVCLPTEGHTRLAEARVLHGLEWLRRQGASPVLVPDAYAPLAVACSLEPIRTEAALYACASQIALQAAAMLHRDPKQICYLLCGSAIPADAQMQLLSLAASAGAIRFYGLPDARLRSRLWRSCGVVSQGEIPETMTTVALLFPGGSLPPADLTVDFTGECSCEGGILWRPSLLPPEGAMSRLPENADPCGFSAILWHCGAIQAREIRVQHLDILGAEPYNNRIVDCSNICTMQDTGGTFHAETIQIDR